MKPTANRVLILIPNAPKEVGGIIMPDHASLDQFPEAKVVAVGPKCVDIRKGDTVIVDRYAMASHRVTVDGKQHFLIAEPDVLGIVSK
jgi:co-chaperonin GroES (HSP10)